MSQGNGTYDTGSKQSSLNTRSKRAVSLRVLKTGYADINQVLLITEFTFSTSQLKKSFKVLWGYLAMLDQVYL